MKQDLAVSDKHEYGLRFGGTLLERFTAIGEGTTAVRTVAPEMHKLLNSAGKDFLFGGRS